MSYMTCPECGADTEGVAKCWLCGCSLPVDQVGTKQDSPGGEPSGIRPAVSRHLQFGIASVLLTMTLIAVLLGVFKLAPGLGLLAVLFITPAFLRATVVATRKKSSGERQTIWQKLVAFAGSFGLIAALLMALGCTYLCSCAVGLIGHELHLLSDNVAIWGSNIVGVVGQLVFTILFIRWLWVRRADQKNRLGDIGFVFSWCGFAMINTNLIIVLAWHWPFNDLEGWGLLALPGLVLSLIAIRRPHRSLTSCGVGLGIAACAATWYFWSYSGFGPRPRTPAAEIELMCLLVGNVLAAAGISAGIYYAARWLEQRHVAAETKATARIDG